MVRYIVRIHETTVTESIHKENEQSNSALFGNKELEFMLTEISESIVEKASRTLNLKNSKKKKLSTLNNFLGAG
jgi:hypothetical protein